MEEGRRKKEEGRRKKEEGIFRKGFSRLALNSRPLNSCKYPRLSVFICLISAVISIKDLCKSKVSKQSQIPN